MTDKDLEKYERLVNFAFGLSIFDFLLTLFVLFVKFVVK